MNVLFFSSFHQSPHFVGLNLEFIQNNLDKGNKVTIIDCNNSYSKCGFNPYALKYMCEICKFREKKGLNMLQGEVEKISLSQMVLDEDVKKSEIYINQLSSISKDDEFEGFRVGEAVMSSYISKTRDREFLSASDQKILKSLAQNSIQIYLSIIRFIKINKIDKLYLLNGRWEYYRAALSAGRFCEIPVEVFENFRSGGYAEVFGNHLPHDIINKRRLIEEHWDKEVNIVKKREISDQFFLKKRKGLAVSDKAYTTGQIKGKLPKDYDPKKKTFVLYNSSDDEFAAVGKQFDNPFFVDQLEGILYIVEILKKEKDFQLIIRMHPNLKGLKKDFLEPLYDIEGKYNNIILIKPEDDIDTYGLMDIADTVISFGSTAGLEASYWGKPVILLGKCFYYYSDVAHLPDSKEDIPFLLKSDLSPKEKDQARKFGYYILSGGTKTNYYYNSPERQFYFNGNSLNELPISIKLKYKVLKLFNIRNKKQPRE